MTGFELLDWLMQVANALVVGITVHLTLHWMVQLRRKNAQLAASTEEIGRQNEELQQHTEELQMQTEELQVLNAELAERERMLQILLEAVQSKADEPAAMERVCQSLLQLMGVPQSAAAILDRSVGEFVVQAQSGSADLQRDRWPVEQSFAAVVLEQQRTGFIEDLRLRPDLITPMQGATELRAFAGHALDPGRATHGRRGVYAAPLDQTRLCHHRMGRRSGRPDPAGAPAAGRFGADQHQPRETGFLLHPRHAGAVARRPTPPSNRPKPASNWRVRCPRPSRTCRLCSSRPPADPRIGPGRNSWGPVITS